jgi:hypothetical protein
MASQSVLQSTPSRLGLRDAVIEILELAGGDVAPCRGAGYQPRTHDLSDLLEREAHLAEQQNRPNQCHRGFVVPALPRPTILGLQDVELLVVTQGGTRHARALRQLSDCQQLTVDHLDLKRTLTALPGQCRRTFEARFGARTNQEGGIFGEHRSLAFKPPGVQRTAQATPFQRSG